jgi:hypothetical protein
MPNTFRTSLLRSIDARLTFVLVLVLSLHLTRDSVRGQELSQPEGAATAVGVMNQGSVEIPDSVRRKVGYQHWKGAAIGGGAGAVAGVLLNLMARTACADCDNDPSVAETGAVVAALGGAFGFLVGLGSPRYEWVPTPVIYDSLPMKSEESER